MTKPCLQAATSSIFYHERQQLIALFKIIDADDMRVVNLRAQLRLQMKTLAVIIEITAAQTRYVSTQNFDGTPRIER